MCGRNVHLIHFAVIAPVILASAYWRVAWPLYVLGGMTLLIHGRLLVQDYAEANKGSSSCGCNAH